MLAGMAVLGGLFAIIHYFGAYGAAIAILFALCIVAHVAGNALGTKLREHGDTPLGEDRVPTFRAAVRAKPTAGDFAPLPRLHGRHSLGRHILVITAIGGFAGGTLGYFGIEWLAGEHVGWKVLAVGCSACVVLGAIWTFAAASFLQVTLGELFQFRRETSHSGHEPRHPL